MFYQRIWEDLIKKTSSQTRFFILLSLPGLLAYHGHPPLGAMESCHAPHSTAQIELGKVAELRRSEGDLLGCIEAIRKRG